MLQHFVSLNNFLLILTAYLLGSIPFGLILSKIFGIGDIRKAGSGNIGATNMLRVGGKKLALFTLIGDMGKGILASYIGAKYSNDAHMVFVTSSIAAIGHIFPIWLKFKGGKGVATSLAILVYCDFKVGMIALGCWAIVFLISRKSSLSSIITFLLAPFFAFYFGSKWLFYMILVISILVIIRHYNNIVRLINRSEKSFF